MVLTTSISDISVLNAAPVGQNGHFSFLSIKNIIQKEYCLDSSVNSFH
ncbi:MAG: hypothetical protein PWQ63_1873 [Methanolobus sp.]|jgi:hypothetical protein|nr:hypothetical protein [Methanolobus sp.]MDK2948713.1 hypothetical protein [Methanolobus sp.]